VHQAHVSHRSPTQIPRYARDDRLLVPVLTLAAQLRTWLGMEGCDDRIRPAMKLNGSRPRMDVFKPAPLLALSLLLLVSCTTTVIPPAAVADPETVVLLTHGKSSSLVLPNEGTGLTRWAFGDWRYYARGRTGPYESAAAVLWPTQGALGRQQIASAPARLDDLIADLGIGIDDVLPLRVERAAVDSLRQRLESLFEANRATLLYNPSPRLEFVHHPEPYTLFNSSNRKVAQWLRELGCTITGVPLLSNWRVETEGRTEP
jgi:hypothetical protein